MLPCTDRRQKPRMSQRRRSFQLRVEALEDRTVPSSLYSYDAGLGIFPEAQGFTRFENQPGAPAPTVSGGILHQFPSSDNNTQFWRANSVPLDFTSTPYTLEADLHVISSDYIPNIGTGQRSGYYLMASDAVGHSFAVGIASNGITINTDAGFDPSNGVPFTPFNSTDSFHVYRLLIGDGMGTLFIDGNLFASTPLGQPLIDVPPGFGFLANRLVFGDLSGQGSSETELRSFSFSTLDSDLAATSLTWDTAQGGVDFGYSVKDAALTQDTKAALYWASGRTFDTVIGSLVYDTTIEHPVGDYGPFYVPNSVLVANSPTNTPPDGAKYLLLVVNPYGAVTESDGPIAKDQNNVEAIPLPDLRISSLAWDPVQGGVKLSVEGTSLPASMNCTVAFFWANGPTYQDRVGDPIYEQVVQLTEGTPVSIPVDQAKLATPPITLAPPAIAATYLIAVVDPHDLILETGKGNNTKDLELKRIEMSPDFRIGEGNITLNNELLGRFLNGPFHN